MLGKGRRKKFRNSKYEGDFGVPASDDEEGAGPNTGRRLSAANGASSSDQEVAGSPSKQPASRRPPLSRLTKTFSRSLGDLAAAGRTPHKKTANAHHLNRSASQVGRRQAIYECDGCGRTYRWKEGLASHKRLYCGKEPRFKCPHCDKRTFQKINLDTHIAAYHAKKDV